MLYDCLKIFHILSAALLITSMAYSYNLWRYMHSPRINAIISDRIQTQTWLIIIPLAIFQLASGFTMISIQNEDLSQSWIIGSVVGFIMLVAGWFGFLYFLLLAQQAPTRSGEYARREKFFRRAQSMTLFICASALLCMIFFMANKTV
jgi:uncharacterized membrane protein